MKFSTKVPMALFLIQICWTAIAYAGQTYNDDFSQRPCNWRLGDVPPTVGPEGMVLAIPQPHAEGGLSGVAETTLLGTAVNPANLRNFSVSLQGIFGKAGNPTLRIGWQKPFEWDSFQASPIFVQVDRKGRTLLHVEGKQIGAWQFKVAENGHFDLTIVQDLHRVVVRSGSQETSFTLPAGFECRPGYLTLQASGPNGSAATIRRIEIKAFSDQPPQTAAQRRDDIQRWARWQMGQDAKMVERLKEYLQAETAAGRWGYRTALEVAPGLVRLGEKTKVTFHITGAVPSPCEATLQWNFLGANPGKVEPLTLDWKPDGRGGQAAVVELSPAQPGNGRIVWRIGDEQLSRMFAVIGDGYATCRLQFTAYTGLRKPDRKGEAYDVLHQYGLAADFWDGSEHTALYCRTPQQLAEEYRVFATMRHRYGDRILPMCQGNYMFSQCPNSNLSWFDRDVQYDGIRQLMQTWDLLGIGPMDLLGSYTYSHDTPVAAQKLGIKAIDTLVQWQNWRDGGDDSAWLINQWGAPTVPYYVAKDDYRKVAQGQSIVALPQGTTSAVRMYYINTLEGEPQLTALRAHSDQMGETSNCDRFQTAVDLLLAESLHQREPMFLFVGLENFCDLPDWDQANTLAIRYLREQAKTKKLVFVSGVDVADYYQRHYSKQPENWFYWPDTYCGYQVAYKPKCVPDRIELSNGEFHSLHEKGSTLPRFFWDYTRPWSEPVWDDQAAIRQQHGLCNPDLLTADNCVPRMVNLAGVKAAAKMIPASDGVGIQIDIESPKLLGCLPVAVWSIPLKAAGLNIAKTSENARFISIVDGSTGNLHGLDVCKNIVPGKNMYNVILQGSAREPVDPVLHIGRHVAGRLFLRNSIPHVYLWLSAKDSPEGVLKITVPQGRKVSVHYNSGKVEESQGGVLLVKLDRNWTTESPMITGLTNQELAASSVFEPAMPGSSKK